MTLRQTTGALAIALLAAPATDAATLCLARNGTLRVRAVCRRKETVADPVALGLQGPQGTPGPTGPTGISGAVGTTGPTGSPGTPSTIKVVVRSMNLGTFQPSDIASDACVSCEQGEVAVGGGISFDSFPGLKGQMRSSRPFPASGTPTGWCASIANIDTTPGNVTLYVNCAAP